MKRSFKILLVSNFLNTIAFGVLGPLYALFVNEAGGSGFHASASWAFYAFLAGSLMFFFGKYEDEMRDRLRTIIAGGFLLLALASASYLAVEVLWQLYFVQGIFALGVAILNPAMKTAYADLEDEGRESEEWAWLEGGNFIILGIASLTGGLLFNYFGFDSIFLLMAGSQLFACLLAYRALDG